MNILDSPKSERRDRAGVVGNENTIVNQVLRGKKMVERTAKHTAMRTA